jgi:hypothetical protein
VPVNACNISADDHESHFVFDLVYNNTTDIQSDSRSVDGHVINHVNAALLYVFGKQFAPPYRNIYDIRNPATPRARRVMSLFPSCRLSGLMVFGAIFIKP